MSQTQTAEPKTTTAPKIRAGHFKCFQCRRVFAGRDGSWKQWLSMEVHLCNGCERSTRSAAERK